MEQPVKRMRLQTIMQIRKNSRCSNCGRRGEVELVIYFRNAVDVKQGESVVI
jgi:predicted NBD/HSP70 family sugar kinase